MCGICGIVARSLGGQTRRIQLLPMLQRMMHRGPHGRGIACSGAAIFGTQRLAIRGLDDGEQPLLDADSGILVACNGEIDNHETLRYWLARRGRHVRQSTDVAVLPQLYLECGESFVDRLEGVFAIALWSPCEDKLILARDRAGERPLFYRADRGVIRFASEIAALVAGSPEQPTVARSAIHGYLHSGCFVAPASPVVGVNKLGPGEVITFHRGERSHRRYWRWPVRRVNKVTPSVTAFDQTFRAALARQSRVDVPYGFFLSGGLDSSLVAAVTRALHPEHQPPCYTLSFTEKSYDESAYAGQVAKALRLDHITVPVEPEMFMRELPVLVRQIAEPIADPAWIPTAILSRRAARDVRLVFSGEGGDELFGGYPTYLGAGLALSYQALPTILRQALRSTVAGLPCSDRKVPLSYLLKRFVEADGCNPLARHRLWTANIAQEVLARLGVPPARYQDDKPVDREDVLDHIQLRDIETTLAEGLLTKGDRAGLSASLEIRAPFLDRHVMEFAATLPAHERVHGVTTKCFLKRYARSYLPHEIIHRRKRGLSVPLAAWLRGPMRDWALERLRCGRLTQVGVDPEAAVALLREHTLGHVDYARPLWVLIVLEEWLAWRQEARQGHELLADDQAMNDERQLAYRALFDEVFTADDASDIPEHIQPRRAPGNDRLRAMLEHKPGRCASVRTSHRPAAAPNAAKPTDKAL
jgi:asparagine synthase (glutamine-hydrolysing)